jgi:peroxiredoxin family protein
MANAPIIPDFDDDSDRKLVIICSKGTLDMAYPGLVLGNAAVTEGIETHLFFTFWGMDMIRTKTADSLMVTPTGNPAMHMPQILGIIPGMSKLAAKMMRKQINDLEVPPVREMLAQIVAGGGRLHACRMSADMMKLSESDYVEEVEDVISAADFMEISEGGQIIFI